MFSYDIILLSAACGILGYYITPYLEELALKVQTHILNAFSRKKHPVSFEDNLRRLKLPKNTVRQLRSIAVDGRQLMALIHADRIDFVKFFGEEVTKRLEAKFFAETNAPEVQSKKLSKEVPKMISDTFFGLNRLEKNKDYTLAAIKKTLTEWYLENSSQIPAEFTIRDFFETAEEKNWIKENTDGTYSVLLPQEQR